jgi:hypothetical protein
MYFSLKDMRIRCQQPVGLLAPKEEKMFVRLKCLNLNRIGCNLRCQIAL